MAVETRAGTETAPEARIDDRAEWTAPCPQLFETASAQIGPLVGTDAYGLS